GVVCGRKASFDSRGLYSYRPRETVGSAGPQFTRGGGEGGGPPARLEVHGVIRAFLPAHRDREKVVADGICARPRHNADTVMNTFQCCWCCRNSYCIGL